MAEKKTSKYIRTGVTSPSNHPEVSSPILSLRSDEGFGNLQFSMALEPITQPFQMLSDSHKHDFDQFLCFIGGDPRNALDLGGEVELTLSEDGKEMEKHVFTTATTVYIPKGLYHAPLNFKRVDKPMTFINMYFSSEYKRVQD
jgi:hypothetical protein